MIMTIGNLAFSSVYKKKKNLTGYIQYYKKMVRQEKKSFRQLCNTECLV